MRAGVCGVLLLWVVGVGSSIAQEPVKAEDAFSRVNTWTVFAEYSPNSTPILMGYARQRILTDLGFGYTRRVARFWGSSISYHVELRPVLFESDPVGFDTDTYTYTSGPMNGHTFTQSSSGTEYRCVASSQSGTFPGIPPYFPSDSYTTTQTCGRQWTFGQAFSPIGFKYEMRTRHSLQPFVIGTLGYMYTSRPVPMPDAEAFNFAFDLGLGIELFRTRSRSMSVEARYHHFSNRDTAPDNPGVDNLMYKVSYSFGR